MPRWLRILALFAAVLTLAVGYWVFLGPQTILCVGARCLYRGNANIRFVPTALVDRSVALPQGKKITYAGYEFQLPWTDIDQERPVGPWKAIIFRSHKSLIVSSLGPTGSINGLLKPLGGVTGPAHLVLDRSILQSDYTFVDALLGVTPQRLTLLSPMHELGRDWILLMIKSMLVSANNGPIFAIAGATWRGFQFGDPKARPHEIVASLYFDRGSLEFRIDQPAIGSDAIRQAELNGLFASVRPEGSAAASRGTAPSAGRTAAY